MQNDNQVVDTSTQQPAKNIRLFRILAGAFSITTAAIMLL